MRYAVKKIDKGYYCYRGFAITYDNERPLGWWITWWNERQYFATRLQAQAQLDRLLATVQEMAQAPTNAEIGALDLSLYVDDALLATVQRRLGDLGRPRTRRQLAQLAQAGQMAPGKRIMLAAVISRLLGL